MEKSTKKIRIKYGYTEKMFSANCLSMHEYDMWEILVTIILWVYKGVFII